MIYCDHNATTPLRPEALEAMLPFLAGSHGNPSSVHALGSRARCAVEDARAAVAALLGVVPATIVFTSGGTESNNHALFGLAEVDRLLVAAVEHSSVRAAAQRLQARGAAVEWLPVDAQGRVAKDFLVPDATTTRATLVSIGWANNEVGTVQSIASISQHCRAAGWLLHVDAVQAAGKIPVSAAPVDLLSLSAHKIGGPQGVGALYIRPGLELEPLLFGGGQERGRRAGTENVPGIVGMGVACTLAQRELAVFAEGTVALRDGLWQALSQRLDGLQRNSPADGLPNTLHVSLEGIRGEALVAALDLQGIAVSSGSACAAGAGEPSHVLLAMGHSNDAARNGVRFSFGRTSRAEDVARIADATVAVVERMRAQQAARGPHA